MIDQPECGQRIIRWGEGVGMAGFAAVAVLCRFGALPLKSVDVALDIYCNETLTQSLRYLARSRYSRIGNLWLGQLFCPAIIFICFCADIESFMRFSFWLAGPLNAVLCWCSGLFCLRGL